MRLTAEQTVTVHRLEPEEVFEVYRLLHSDPPPEEDFRSGYERGNRPRKYEREWAVIHRAISSLDDLTRARQLARNVPQIQATHVALLRLTHGHGFNVASTGSIPGHFSVWGDPVKLMAAVVDIVPVDTN